MESVSQSVSQSVSRSVSHIARHLVGWTLAMLVVSRKPNRFLIKGSWTHEDTPKAYEVAEAEDTVLFVCL
jgi:hypothetical protein